MIQNVHMEIRVCPVFAFDYVEYFSYLFSMITNDARSTRGIKTRFCICKSKFQKGEEFFHQQIRLKFKNVISKDFISSVAFYGAKP
jgi:hypothetical protein